MCTHPCIVSQLARETTARCSRRLAAGSCAAGNDVKQPGTRTAPARSSAAPPWRLPVRASRPREAAPPSTTWQLATAEPAAGLTKQRQCPDGRRTSRGAAYGARGRERDAR